MISWSYEAKHWSEECFLIAGIDEVGRGPLAGPVVAAAVILPKNFSHPLLNDSKKLTATRRKKIAKELRENPEVIWSIAEATVEEIDQKNILQATFIAMQRAFSALTVKPHFALVDGNQNPRLSCPLETLIGGDGKSPSIAAASIIAKQYRDDLMDQLALEYPHYGFEKHKGYGTAAHLKALQELGPCPIHRMSFEPVRLTLERKK